MKLEKMGTNKRHTMHNKQTEGVYSCAYSFALKPVLDVVL